MFEPGFIYQITFLDRVPIETIEKNLACAAYSAACEHGREKVRLDTTYSFDPEKRRCVIDGRTPIGEAVAKMFTGYMSDECGESCFTIDRLLEFPKPQEEPS